MGERAFGAELAIALQNALAMSTKRTSANGIDENGKRHDENTRDKSEKGGSPYLGKVFTRCLI